MSGIYGIEGKVGPSALGYFFQLATQGDALGWDNVAPLALGFGGLPEFRGARAAIAIFDAIPACMNWLLQGFRGPQFPKTERQARYGIERSLFVGFLLFVWIYLGPTGNHSHDGQIGRIFYEFRFWISIFIATETLNWGHPLVYWTADRDIGGKMFAMTDLDGTGYGVLLFHCGAERFDELIEREDIVPSPYLAKAHWVTLLRWDALRAREIEEELRRAYELIAAKLPLRALKILGLPEKERKLVIRERKKKVLAAKAAVKTK